MYVRRRATKIEVKFFEKTPMNLGFYFTHLRAAALGTIGESKFFHTATIDRFADPALEHSAIY
jgi:hypothetical protein